MHLACFMHKDFYTTGTSDEDEDHDESVGLDAVYAENLDDLSDEGDYEAGEEEEDEDGIEEEEGEGEEDAHISEGESFFCTYCYSSVLFILYKTRGFSVIE